MLGGKDVLGHNRTNSQQGEAGLRSGGGQIAAGQVLTVFKTAKTWGWGLAHLLLRGYFETSAI